MWTRQEIKERGKAAFRANYWKCVVASLLLALVTGASAGGSSSSNSGESVNTTEEASQFFQNLTPEQIIAIAGISVGAVVIGILIKIFLVNPLQVGCYNFFKLNVKNPGTPLGPIADGFKDFGRTFVALFLRDLLILVFCLLLVVPGIIKAYEYRMVPYLLTDNPELSGMDLLNRSKEMMRGHKWNAFVYDLSFIGWEILGALTVGILDVFWVRPYKNSSDAALYLKLKG
ncbi:MAG: DUF975 family protein [Lachnospiraceae bacterium]|nr:DUF975 family protein [Lachnospiraceae bacterium]